MVLLRQMINLDRHHTVIEPICASMDGEKVDGIRVIGKFIEKVDLANDLEQPDLVICRHTMEHIARSNNVIKQWFKQ